MEPDDAVGVTTRTAASSKEDGLSGYLKYQEFVAGEREVWCEATAALATVNGYEIRLSSSHCDHMGRCGE